MLVIGYGNPGRMDDGLGPAFAEMLAAAKLPGVELQQDYQLTVEHALSLTGIETVVFADALMGAGEPFQFTALEAGCHADITSHNLTPSALLTLAATLYGATPEAYVMGISGQEFGEVKEGLSPKAAQNLERAFSFFVDWVARAGSIDGISERGCEPAPLHPTSQPS